MKFREKYLMPEQYRPSCQHSIYIRGADRTTVVHASFTQHVHTTTMAFSASVSIIDDNAIVDKLTIDDLPPMPDTNLLCQTWYDHYECKTKKIFRMLYSRDTNGNYRISNTCSAHDLELFKCHIQLYVREQLNPDQRDVFDYVTANPNDIVLLQGGAGTGKTFTMLTVGNHFVKTGKPPNAVIFKRDTDDTVLDYRLSANAFTVKQFITRIFQLNSSDYYKLERQLNEPMSVEHFLNAVIYLTQNLKLCPDGEDFRHPLLILELYAVEPKPFLLIIMMTLHRYRIGAVICADKNLLQNAYNTGQCSAYDIVSTFSTKTFNLSRNLRLLRCYDSTYNDKVNFISTLSNNIKLDDWGYALVSAMFYKNLVKNIVSADTILAKSPKYLTKTVVKMVKEKKIPTSYWLLKKFDNVILPSVYFNKDKYLEYLPLIVGNPYYVNMSSESLPCLLEKINFKDEHETEIQTLTVRIWNTNEKKTIEKGECTSVMFNKLRANMFSDGDCSQPRDSSWYLYNFPLYPAFIKTMHMSMGRTFKRNVSLILNESTYRNLYVAMSRVQSSKNINSVVIPNQLEHLISVVLNFDVTDLMHLEIDQIKEKLLNGNYVYYDASPKTHDPNALGKLKIVAEHSLSLDDENQRVTARENLKNLVNMMKIPTQVLRSNVNQADAIQSAAHKMTLPFYLKMKNTITSLATLTSLESRVWIHEFLCETKTQEYMRVCGNSVFSTVGDLREKFKELNDTCDFTVSKTYGGRETSMGFMKKTSTQKYKADLEADPELLKEWIVIKAAEDKESPLVAATIPTPNDDTVQCVKVFIHDLVYRDRRDSNQLYELLKKRIKNNTKKRAVQ